MPENSKCYPCLHKHGKFCSTPSHSGYVNRHRVSKSSIWMISGAVGNYFGGLDHSNGLLAYLLSACAAPWSGSYRLLCVESCTTKKIFRGATIFDVHFLALGLVLVLHVTALGLVDKPAKKRRRLGGRGGGWGHMCRIPVGRSWGVRRRCTPACMRG